MRTNHVTLKSLIMPLAIGMALTTGAIGAATAAEQTANPCAAKAQSPENPCSANPCAVNPCAAENPSAATPNAANPCAAKSPSAANPCAAFPQ